MFKVENFQSLHCLGHSLIPKTGNFSSHLSRLPQRGYEFWNFLEGSILFLLPETIMRVL